MKLSTFNKLQEIVKACDFTYKTKPSIEFDYDSVTNGFNTAEILILSEENETYFIVIDEADIVSLRTQNGTVCRINDEDADKWVKYATEIFRCTYADEIEESQNENDYWDWIDNSTSDRAAQHRSYSF